MVPLALGSVGPSARYRTTKWEIRWPMAAIFSAQAESFAAHELGEQCDHCSGCHQGRPDLGRMQGQGNDEDSDQQEDYEANADLFHEDLPSVWHQLACTSSVGVYRTALTTQDDC